ncbi:MAG TPA: ATP-binding protein [Candidatus Sulfotelmatobacter sp.]|nr:ATP-binding protein [Candidatus Sulfotelmatobacter sp.]
MKDRLDPFTNFRELTRFRKLSAFWTAALVGMAALLVTVGVLQYRWTSQITEATETRMGNNVESLMLDWHLDFYQRFAAICVALQVGPDSGEHDDWIAYRERYNNWKRIANHPAFIRNLYIWETSQPSRPRLLRFGSAQTPLEEVNPPDAVGRLLERLRDRSADINEALRAWEFAKEDEQAPQQLQERGRNVSRDTPLTGWQFDQSIPAIVHPLIHHAYGDEKEEQRRAVDWIVVVLDMTALRQGILPDVTQKYVANDQYELGVTIGGEAGQLIYASDELANSSLPAHVDATMNIFGPPPESTEGYFWQAFKNGNSLTGLEWHSFSGPVWFPVLQYGREQQPWTLILKNQNGPLLTAVGQLRRRNLIISAMVLLLLLGGMGVVAVATHRAQRLAKLEMEFVASVSHELRTPLSAIFSAGENISDGLIEGKAALMRYGSIITGQATQLIDLVDQVLLFAGTRDGSKHYLLRPLPIEEIVRAVQENVAALVLEAGATIHVVLEENLPHVLGDRGALIRCLQNLVTNAIKYSPPNCEIEIGAAAKRDGSVVREIGIYVRDHGVGIACADLPHIFEPFYRSPQVISAQIHGTGLGLALAKGIAEAMGGGLSVVSEIGKGSTFTIHLPVLDFGKRAESRLDQEEWVNRDE